MVSLLALLPRSLTTFLYAVAALLRFYGNLNTTPFPLIPLTILGWSFLAFALGTAALLANLSLEWNTGNRSRNREIEARERETRQDNLANEERSKADQEQSKADRERKRASSRARIQNRGFILQTRHQLTPSPDTRSALTDFLSFLQEYGE